MDKRRVFVHPDYFTTLRKAKAEAGIADLTPIVRDVHRILTEEENPLAFAQPVDRRPGRWTLEIKGLRFEIEPDGQDILLAEVSIKP